MDIWQAIRDDHDAIEAMFDAIDAGGDRVRLVAELKAALEAHAQGEEKVVYPELAKIGDLGALIQLAREEHTQMRRILAEIETADEDEQLDLIAALEETVQEHVEEEEDDVLPLAETSISAETAKEMLRRFEAVKKAAAKA